MINARHILMLKRYLNNQLSVAEKNWFENLLINNTNLCEELKALNIMPDHIFVKMYKAIKEIKYYHTKEQSA